MAWFEGISSSLKGQISNLAKGLTEDSEDKGAAENSNLSLPRTSNESRPGTSADGWTDEILVSNQLVDHGSPGSSRSNDGQSNTQPQAEEETSLISKKLASFLSLGKGSDAEEQIAVLQEENRTLRQDNESKANEIRTCTRIIRELESLVAVGQDENSNLSTGMEELDIQHQQAIEQVLSVKEETHKQLEALQKAHADLEESYRFLSEEKANDNERKESSNVEEIQRLREENARLVRELEESQKKASQNDVLLHELEERDKELEELEGVNITLRSDIELLRNDPESNRNSLPPIPEHNEEIEALEHRISLLESETSILREVRSNLETEVSNSGAKIEELNQKLQTAESSLRNNENLQLELERANVSREKAEKEAENHHKHITHLESELEKVKSEADQLNQEITVRDKDKELSWYENHSKEESMMQENAALRKKVNQLEMQAKEVDKELEKLQKENETKQNKMCEIMFEMNTLSESLKKSLEKEADYKLQIKELELKLVSNKDHEDEVSQEVNKLMQLKEELVKLNEENSMLQDELETKTSEIDSTKKCIQAEREKHSLDMSLLENEIETLKNVSHEFQIYKDIQKQKDSEFKRQLESKEEELNKIKTNIEEKEFNWNEQFTTTLSDLEVKISHQEAELNRLRQLDLDRSNIEKNANSEVETLKKSLQSAKEEYEKLKTESEKREKLISEDFALKYEEHEKQIVQKLVDRIAEQDKQLESALNNYNNVKIQFESLQEKYTNIEKELSNQVNDSKELLKRIQIKEVVATGLASEVEEIKVYLKQEKENNEKLQATIDQLASSKSEIENQLKEKENYLEQIDGTKSKEITTLKQEVESLKNQLEYATQLMHIAERQEAEGRGVTPPPQQGCTNECHDMKAELGKITTALLQEQTENKLLVNQVSELKDANAKLNTQLSRLQSHLVEIGNYYTSIEVSSREKIAELEAKQAKVDDWVKTSSTAYTSANIRANQQVESLTQQVRLLMEHKEKMEAELSRAEDEAQKQLAAVTNLQAVLQQFQRDKQRDVEFETDRIKEKLNQSYKANDQLASQIKDLQDQLNENKKGLVAATRLTEQLDQKEQQILSLQKEVGELRKIQTLNEEKLKNISSTFEGKIDMNLMKNLLIGYVSSGPKYKEQALRVIAQVLELSKEERLRIGLDLDESSTLQVSLSEAFIRFLETESQPKPQVFVPLSQPKSTTPSRKTSQSSSAGSILLEEAHLNLPNFTVGRNAGSILKDVLKDRNS